jgi:hypothetical protein
MYKIQNRLLIFSKGLQSSARKKEKIILLSCLLTPISMNLNKFENRGEKAE